MRRSLSHHEIGATAAVDPDAAVVRSPRLSLDTWRPADLTAQGNVTARELAPVAAIVIRRTVDNLPWSGTTAPVATNHEVGATAAVDPDAVIVPPPCLSLDARRAAHLAAEGDVAARKVAPVAATIIGRAGDDLPRPTRSSGAADDEFSAAPAVHPDVPVVPSPGLPLDAGRPADLAAHPNTAAGICGAEVAAAVIRGAGNGLARKLPCKRPARQTKGEEKSCKKEKLRGEFHVAPLSSANNCGLSGRITLQAKEDGSGKKGPVE